MVALLSVIIASLFMPVFAITPTVNAAVSSCELDSSGWKSIPTGPISDRKKLNWNEQFNIQFAVAFDIKDSYTLELAKYCKDNKQKHNFYIYAYATIQTLSARGDVVTRTVKSDKPLEVPAQFYTVADSSDKTKITEYGYAARVPATVKSFFPNAPTSNSTVCDKQPCLINTSVYVYYGQSWTSYKFPGILGISYSDQAIQGDQPTQLPPLPDGVTAGGPVGTGAKTGVDYTKIGMTVTANSAGKGLRSKYRVLLSDNSMTFSGNNGPDPIYMKWTSEDPALQLTVNDTFTLPKKDNSWFNYDLEPAYKGSNLGFNYADTPVKNLESCAPAYFSTDCSKAFFESDKGLTNGNGTEKPLPDQFSPVLNSSAWLRNRNDKAEAGKPIATNEFKVVAFIKGFSAKVGIGQNTNVYVLYNSEAKFTVEVYRTLDEIKTACKADVPEDQKSKCDSDPNFAKYGFADTVTAEAKSSELQDGGIASNLFAFLRKVIAYIILLMTSIMYYIFAYILVPVLNALLKIQPYRDEFVNVIYPGWVIIRNISNIAFIIALLVMGLRILFQQEDASKSRGFIVTLVLMALLVNFSLVIGQGIVGIADTVQSQFLPAKSKVVEALGQKLMVDPIKTFRSGEYSVTDSGNTFTVDGSASDLFKPIALWVLAGAAFWSFVALIAFMFIRLVALWVLYMLSPLAYVGRILPETRTYANQWWSHFLKYAFTVPILAFFLNITALVAVTFSGRMGDVIKSTGTFAGELTEFALTVISHFIVLLFLFIGMKFALSFGGAGAKQVVDFAKKGMDWTTRKGPKALGMWAKDNAADSISNRLKENNPRLAAGVSALAQPMITGKKLKDRLWSEPKKAQMERLEKARKPLDDYAKQAGLNKVQAAKMLAWKLTGNSAKAVQRRSDRFAGLLTDDERIQNGDKISQGRTDLSDIASYRRLGSDQITKAQAEVYQKRLGEDINELNKAEETELAPLNEQRAKALAAGNNQRGTELQTEIDSIRAGYESRRNPLETSKENIDNILKALPATAVPSTAVVMPSVLEADKALEINAEVIQADIDKLQGDLTADDNLRTDLGVSKWDANDRATVLAGMEKIVAERQFPASQQQQTDRLASEHEEGKKFEGVDDVDSLRAAFNNAMKNNNLAQASAIAKKIAKEGGFKDLLSEHGFKNNIDGFKKFMSDKFGRVPVVVRNQMASELSNLNMQNGNRALGKATNINSQGVVNWNSRSEQMEKLSKTAGKKKVWEKKPNEIFYENESGDNEFISGEVEELKKLSGNKKALAQLESRMSSYTAAEILKKHAAGALTGLGGDVVASLGKARGKI